MSPERWQEVSRLFHEAVAQPGHRRGALLEHVGTSDPDLRAAVERLLAAHDSTESEFLSPIDPARVAALIESTPADDPIPRLGHYDIIRCLGRGGMGVVYLAHDTRLRRQVAVKVLRSPFGLGQAGGTQLLAEAQAASALDHPNAVPVHEVGEAPDGRLFLVMAFAGEESLADRLRNGPLEIRQAVEIARQLADVLAAAHRAGIVHRDVKPSNVILSGEDRARLVDFGIARLRGETSMPLAGTPAYMSPEQTRGEPVDHRTDLWSLGVVLSEMLSGRRPFQASDQAGMITRIQRGDPAPLRALRPEVPDDLAEIVEACLAPAVEARPPDAEWVTAGLDRVLDDIGSTARRRTRVRALLAAGGALGVTAAVALLLVDPRSAIQEGPPGTIAILPFAPVSHDTALLRLGRELVVTLSGNLDASEQLTVVEPISVLSQVDTPGDLTTAARLARELGAGRMVRGQLTRSGADIRLDAAVYSTADLSVQGRASVTAPAGEVVQLTDRATTELLLAAWPSPERPLPNLKAITTASPAALRAYLDGELALAGGRFRSAPLAFARAIQEDSTFYFAAWRYLYARSYHGEPVDPTIRAMVLDHRASLPEPDRMMVDIRLVPNEASKLTARRALTDRFPQYWPGWFDLADQLVHHGVFLGRSFDEAVAALERTVQLNPRMVPAWEHLLWLSVHRRDSSASGRALSRLTVLRADSLLRDEWDLQTLDYYRYLDALVRTAGRPIPREAAIGADVLSRYRGPLAPERLAATLTKYGFFRAQLDLSRRVRALDPPRAIDAAHWWGEALAWAGRGAWDSALIALNRYTTATNHPQGAIWAFGLATTGAWLGALGPEQVARLRRPAAQSEAGRTAAGRSELLWLDGLLACARGDRDGLRVASTALAGSSYDGANRLTRSLEALEATLPGNRAAADLLMEDEATAADSALAFRSGSQHPFLTAINRFAAARWLLVSGDSVRAERLLRLHQTDLPGTLHPMQSVHLILGTLLLPELAGIEDARGLPDRARQTRALFEERADLVPSSGLLDRMRPATSCGARGA